MNDHIYWTFSAAAQSISAFVALLLTGYALVHTIMEAARDRDDSLEEVYAVLRLSYHRRLTILAWLTGCSVILSLVIVYMNKSGSTVPTWSIYSVGLIDFAAIFFGLSFVISIVDPRKYQKAAESVLGQPRVDDKGVTNVTPAAEFFDGFIHLEKLVRNYLKSNDLCVVNAGSPRTMYSFRQMIDALLRGEAVDRSFCDELLEINRYRNLVFHGHVSNADENMVKRVRAAAARMEQLV